MSTRRFCSLDGVTVYLDAFRLAARTVGIHSYVSTSVKYNIGSLLGPRQNGPVLSTRSVRVGRLPLDACWSPKGRRLSVS
jgi:hypothetical protein